MAKKLYISGPMTGHPCLNYPAFQIAAAYFRGLGWEVISPAELNPIGTEYKAAMARDIEALLTCDAIVLLRGWENSRGAKLELMVAQALELEQLGEAVIFYAV